MSEKNQILYLKIEMNTLVKNHLVRLEDIAKMECDDQAILRQIRQKKIYSFPEETRRFMGRHQRVQVFSILKIVQLIHEEYPSLEIVNEGETDFILEYMPVPKLPKWLEILETIVLCIIIFFGAGFTIMAFNNDISITDVFSKLYLQVMGVESDGVTELEICYCIGLGLGITIFFNHVGHRKITHDPTPIQIEMRKYEKDVDTTLIENAGRKGHSMDVR